MTRRRSEPSAGVLTETRHGVSSGSDSNERLRVAALGAAIVLTLAAYLGLRPESGTLMPFQTLARDLVQEDQAMFASLQERILQLEAIRGRTGRWPDPDAAGLPRQAPAAAAPPAAYTWQRSQQGIVVNYLARPESGDLSAAWLVVYREPDPAAPVDIAPNDEEHHRLPDGTVLHISLWTRRFGGQAPGEFVPKPEAAGWTQVLTAPLARPTAPSSARPQ